MSKAKTVNGIRYQRGLEPRRAAGLGRRCLRGLGDGEAGRPALQGRALPPRQFSGKQPVPPGRTPMPTTSGRGRLVSSYEAEKKKHNLLEGSA